MAPGASGTPWRCPTPAARRQAARRDTSGQGRSARSLPYAAGDEVLAPEAIVGVTEPCENAVSRHPRARIRQSAGSCDADAGPGCPVRLLACRATARQDPGSRRVARASGSSQYATPGESRPSASCHASDGGEPPTGLSKEPMRNGIRNPHHGRHRRLCHRSSRSRAQVRQADRFVFLRSPSVRSQIYSYNTNAGASPELRYLHALSGEPSRSDRQCAFRATLSLISGQVYAQRWSAAA
jgi:hypothetical protein